MPAARIPKVVWMKKKWKLKENPFPSEAIARLGGEDPRENGQLFDPDVQPEKLAEAAEKFVLGAAYGGQKFGYLWSLVRPLLQGVVLYVVFSKVIRLDVEDYGLVLLAGLFPWTWFQTSLVFAVGSFASNGALIKKVYFPRFVLPLATVMNNGVQFALSLPVLILLLVAFAERNSIDSIIHAKRD